LIILLEKSEYNFLGYIRKNFGDDLADMLESKNMLAFDLNEDDEDVFLSKHQSLN
jgi:hypothetical protein